MCSQLFISLEWGENISFIRNWCLLIFKSVRPSITELVLFQTLSTSDFQTQVISVKFLRQVISHILPKVRAGTYVLDGSAKSSPGNFRIKPQSVQFVILSTKQRQNEYLKIKQVHDHLTKLKKHSYYINYFY